MKISIRSALLAVTVLGLLTCGLALFILVRPLTAAYPGRSERAREAVESEVQRLRSAGSNAAEVATSSGPTTRSGIASSGETFESHDLPWSDAPKMLRALLAKSQGTHSQASDRAQTDDGILCAAVEPTERGDRYVWAAYMMAPPRWTPVLRVVGVVLGFVALALVVSATFAVLAVRRGAGALSRCLAALGRDLSTPVPRSRIKELSVVADGIATLAHDLGRAQDELAERERLAVLGRVTAGVAHELRNPLAVMKLRIDILRRSAKSSAEMGGELDVVVDEIVRLDRLVNDLLTIAGRKIGDRQLADLGELAQRRAELLKPLGSERRVAIAVSGSGRAKIDGDAIARVLDNVLKNAIEASPAGSDVHVEVERTGDSVSVRCIDRGIGVAPDRADELFEPFFTTKAEGVGLGLALSRAIAAAHGGTLTYVREHDSTVFELRLTGAA